MTEEKSPTPPFLKEVMDALFLKSPSTPSAPKRISLPVDVEELPVLLDALLAHQERLQMPADAAATTKSADDIEANEIRAIKQAHATLLAVRVRQLMGVHSVK